MRGWAFGCAPKSRWPFWADRPRGSARLLGQPVPQPLHTLHVECPLGSIPEAIRIDITNLTLGQPIHVRELTLPEGVKVLEAPEAVVVQLKLPGVEAAAAPTLGEPGAGPEVIKKEKKTEDEGDEGKK